MNESGRKTRFGSLETRGEQQMQHQHEGHARVNNNSSLATLLTVFEKVLEEYVDSQEASGNRNGSIDQFLARIQSLFVETASQKTGGRVKKYKHQTQIVENASQVIEALKAENDRVAELNNVLVRQIHLQRENFQKNLEAMDDLARKLKGEIDELTKQLQQTEQAYAFQSKQFLDERDILQQTVEAFQRGEQMLPEGFAEKQREDRTLALQVARKYKEKVAGLKKQLQEAKQREVELQEHLHEVALRDNEEKNGYQKQLQLIEAQIAQVQMHYEAILETDRIKAKEEIEKQSLWFEKEMALANLSHVNELEELENRVRQRVKNEGKTEAKDLLELVQKECKSSVSRLATRQSEGFTEVKNLMRSQNENLVKLQREVEAAKHKQEISSAGLSSEIISLRQSISEHQHAGLPQQNQGRLLIQQGTLPARVRGKVILLSASLCALKGELLSVRREVKACCEFSGSLVSQLRSELTKPTGVVSSSILSRVSSLENSLKNLASQQQQEVSRSTSLHVVASPNRQDNELLRLNRVLSAELSSARNAQDRKINDISQVNSALQTRVQVLQEEKDSLKQQLKEKKKVVNQSKLQKDFQNVQEIRKLIEQSYLTISSVNNNVGLPQSQPTVPALQQPSANTSQNTFARTPTASTFTRTPLSRNTPHSTWNTRSARNLSFQSTTNKLHAHVHSGDEQDLQIPSKHQTFIVESAAERPDRGISRDDGDNQVLLREASSDRHSPGRPSTLNQQREQSIAHHKSAGKLSQITQTVANTFLPMRRTNSNNQMKRTTNDTLKQNNPPIYGWMYRREGGGLSSDQIKAILAGAANQQKEEMKRQVDLHQSYQLNDSKSHTNRKFLEDLVNSKVDPQHALSSQVRDLRRQKLHTLEEKINPSIELQQSSIAANQEYWMQAYESQIGKSSSVATAAKSSAADKSIQRRSGLFH